MRAKTKTVQPEREAILGAGEGRKSRAPNIFERGGAGTLTAALLRFFAQPQVAKKNVTFGFNRLSPGTLAFWAHIWTKRRESREACPLGCLKFESVALESSIALELVMAGLVPAIHVFILKWSQRGRPNPDCWRQSIEPSRRVTNA